MKIVALPVVLALGLVLSACGGTPIPAETVAEETPSATPTPTPEPAPPAAADLVVTTEGLGTLRIGQPPIQDPATDMVTYSEDVCASADYGIGADDPYSAGWPPLAIYGDGRPTTGPDDWYALFAIGVKDGLVTRIDITDSTIPTNGGLHIGDPASSIMTAHPDAVVALSSPVSKVYRVTGTAGVLDIEVEAGQDKVSWIRVDAAGTPVYGVAASDNVLFNCKYSA